MKLRRTVKIMNDNKINLMQVNLYTYIKQNNKTITYSIQKNIIMFVVKDIRDELIEYKCTNNKDIVIKLFKNFIKLKLKTLNVNGEYSLYYHLLIKIEIKHIALMKRIASFKITLYNVRHNIDNYKLSKT